ncbi:MAG: hypothetical protein AB7I52_10745 [Rhizobiaceae bacterium]
MCLFCRPSSGTQRLRQRRPTSPEERLVGVPDLILVNATVLTMDAEPAEAHAVAAREGFVQAVGGNDAIAARRGRTTRIIDLEGSVLAPGFIAPDLKKSPCDFLAWQVVSPPQGAAGDVRNYLSSTVAPPMFGEPTFVGIDGEGPVPEALVVDHLATMFAAKPLLLDTGRRAFLNAPMRAVLGETLVDRLSCADTGGTLAATDRLDELLSETSAVLDYSAAAARSVLQARLQDTARAGFTTVLDRRFGSIAGRHELDAACTVAKRRNVSRLHVTADTRLREVWNGVLPEGDLRLTVAGARLTLRAGDEAAREDAELLDAAGWQIVFDVADADGLHAAIELCERLARSGGQCHHRIDAPPGLDIPSTATRFVSPGPDLPSGEEGIRQRLEALTAGAARRHGIEHYAGTIARGRAADMVALQRDAFRDGVISIGRCWIEGIEI